MNDPRSIEDLKCELRSYDYVGTKIAMGVATKEDYATEIAYTETLRQKIRELQNPNALTAEEALDIILKVNQ